MLSVLAIASIASTAVLGNIQPAYAGFNCTVDPTMVDTGVLPVGGSHDVLKLLECDGGSFVGIEIIVDDCALDDIDVSFDDPLLDDLGGWWLPETIVNNNSIPGKKTCIVFFDIFFVEDVQTITQTIMVTTPETTVVGGEFSPINSAALVLAGLQTSAIWMLPVLAGVAGSAFGILYIKSRRN